ncbi:MAG: thermostable hemolysin [Motiliproteus sp.]
MAQQQEKSETPQQRESNIFLVTREDNRSLVEAFVQQRFHEDYQADIHSFAENMIVLANRHNQPNAVIGYQNAARGPLFLEQYLDNPIEVELQKLGCPGVQRQQILEVGNLASNNAGSTRRLILSLISYFYQQGYRWLVLTATPPVLNSFHKLGVGLELMPIAAASATRLHTQRDNWGSYYDNHPQVVAGQFGNGLELLNQNRVLASLIQRAPQPVPDQLIQFRAPN